MFQQNLGGTFYVYERVPPRAFIKAITAASVGAVVHELIVKGGHPYRKATMEEVMTL